MLFCCLLNTKNIIIIISLYFITILLLLVIHRYILLGTWELFECRRKWYFPTVHDSFEFHKKYSNSDFRKVKTSQNYTVTENKCWNHWNTTCIQSLGLRNGVLFNSSKSMGKFNKRELIKHNWSIEFDDNNFIGLEMEHIPSLSLNANNFHRIPEFWWARLMIT